MNANQDWVTKMEDRYGPIISGKHLYGALGFKTYAAFYRSLQLEEIGVKIFRIAGRKGWFAKTIDIANWINQQSVEEKE